MAVVCTLSMRFQPRFGGIAIVLQAWQQIHTAGSIRSSHLEPSTSATNGTRDNVSRNQPGCSPARDAVSISPRVNATLNSIVVGESSSRTSSVADSNRRQNDGKRGLRQTVMEFLNQFMQGTKQLWTEIGQARKTAGRKKAGEVVTFQEDRLLRQVPRDVVKALPLLVVFAVPFAGYISPLIAFFYPKTLLPAQFWTPHQRLEYMLQDAIEQEFLLFPKLLRCLAGLKTPPRPNSTPQQLQDSVRWFDGEGSLDRLSRHHLIRLAQTCNTMPPFKKTAARFVFKSTIVAWLTSEAAAIRDDDTALRRMLFNGRALVLQAGDIDGEGSEGTKLVTVGQKVALPSSEVELLCWERGLLRSQHWYDGELKSGAMDGQLSTAEATAMLKSLQDWLLLYDEADTAFASTSSPGSTQHSETTIPYSMILHAPALLRLPHSAREKSPLYHLRVRPLEHIGGTS